MWYPVDYSMNAAGYALPSPYGSHRFNLAASHIGIDAQWTREGAGHDAHASGRRPRCNGAGQRSFTQLYTFRQQFADNPGHTIIQALPLLGAEGGAQ